MKGKAFLGNGSRAGVSKLWSQRSKFQPLKKLKNLRSATITKLNAENKKAFIKHRK